MRYKYIVFISLLLVCYNSFSNIDITNIINKDTIYICYSIAYFGEYGGADEGVMIYREGDVLKAKYVKYNSKNFNYASFSFNKESIIEYFTEIKVDYQIIKDVWILDTFQIQRINNILDNFITTSIANGISNAPDIYYYSVLGYENVIIDSGGNWDKYKEIHQAFNIEVKVPKRLYLLGIKLKEREVEYIVK